MKRAARMTASSFSVERVGDGQGVGVSLDDAAQRGAGTVDGFDAQQVGFDQLSRAERAGGHVGLQLVDGDFVQIHVGAQDNSR